MHCVAKDAARGRLGGEPVGRSERMAWWATPTENPADDPADDPAAAQWAARRRPGAAQKLRMTPAVKLAPYSGYQA